MKTHLEKAINYYKDLAELNFNIFGDIVVDYLLEGGINNIHELNFFIAFYNNSTDIVLKYSITKGEPILGVSRGKSLIIKDIDIETKAKELYKKVGKKLGSLDLKKMETPVRIAKGFAAVDQLKKDHRYKVTNDSKVSLLSSVKERISDIDLRRGLVKLALSELDKPRKDKIIKETNENLFGFIGKSILNAEYLILPEYSRLLDSIEKAYDPREDETSRDGEFYTLKSFLKISWFLQETCSFIKRYLDEKFPFNLVHVNSDREERFKRMVIIEPELEGKENTIIFENLLTSIIDMTVIDHCFKSTPETVEKLFNLHEQFKTIESLSLNSLGESVVSASKFKCASMLDRILNDEYHKKSKAIEVDYDYIISSNKGKRKLLDQIKGSRILDDQIEGNTFLTSRKQYKGHELQLEKTLYDSSTEGRPKDIERYHTAIKIGINSYRQQSKIIALIAAYKSGDKKREDAILEIKKYYQENKIENLSTSLFNQLLELISQEIQFLHSLPKLTNEQIITLQKNVFFYKEIIDELSIYLRKYKTNIPFYYRPTFEYSFYNCKDGYFSGAIDTDLINHYKCDDFLDKFFFASLLCTPANYDYWEGLYTQHRANYDKYYSNYEKIFSESLQSAIKLAEKHLDDTVDNKISDFNLKLLKLSQDISKRHVETTMVTLGIFAAFIAFVTIAINMVKIADNITEFVCFTGTFMGCLLLFAVYVKHSPLTHHDFSSLKPSKKEDIKAMFKMKGEYLKKSRNNFICNFLLVFAAWLFIFTPSYFASDKADFLTTEKHKKYDVSIAHQDSLLDRNKAILEQYQAQVNNLNHLIEKQDSVIKSMKKKLKIKD